jgi:hypothetical protein
MSAENVVYKTTSTMHKYHTELTQNIKNLLNLHPAHYSQTQEAVILHTCRVVRKFLTEQ